jgi:hypothetical protein
MTETPPNKYIGVNYHGKKYSAHFKFRKTNWRFGSYENPEHAAWVVDFCKYIFHGMNVAYWDPHIGKPNFPPGYREDFPRFIAMKQMLDRCMISPAELDRRIAIYDAAVAEKAKAEAITPTSWL